MKTSSKIIVGVVLFVAALFVLTCGVGVIRYDSERGKIGRVSPAYSSPIN